MHSLCGSTYVCHSEQLQRKQKQYKDLEDFMETHKQQKESMEANKAEQKRKVSLILQDFNHTKIIILN